MYSLPCSVHRCQLLGSLRTATRTILQDRHEATSDSRLCGFLATVQLNALLRTAAFHSYQT
jgi:hypothetical protein